MELVAGILLPVVIIFAGILHSKNTNTEEKKSYKEPEIGIVEKIVKQESPETNTEDKLVKKEIQQKVEIANSSNQTHIVSNIDKTNENLQDSSSSPEVKVAKTKDEKPFKYNIDVIEGTINHYVSIAITPNLDRSIVEIRQKVEKLSLMSEFVKVKAYLSKQPKIYEEYSTPPVDYKNNTAIIRFPIDKKYEFYQFQYSVKGPFKEPEVIYVK